MSSRLERIDELLEELKELQKPFDLSSLIHSTPFALIIEGILDEGNQDFALLIAQMAIEKAKQKK